MKFVEAVTLIIMLSRCCHSGRRLIFSCHSDDHSCGIVDHLKFNNDKMQNLINRLDNCKQKNPPPTRPEVPPTYYVGPKPLAEIFQWIPHDGVYDIIMKYGTIVPGYFETREGYVWLVIQKRTTGLLSFYRNWESYKDGFGEVEKEFWWGMEYLTFILNEDPYILRIDLLDDESNVAWAEYTNFTIANETSNYALSIDGYSGTAGDSMAFHNNQSFTTIDKDNDEWIDGNCAREHYGAWWYAKCQVSNLNGLYITGGQISNRAINWYSWKKNYYSYLQCKMKLRPHTLS